MITAVDSNVLLDVFRPDPEFGPRSLEAMKRCVAEGALIACEVVWAEASALFPSTDAALDALARAGVAYVPMEAPDALAAGRTWGRHRSPERTRDRLVADFLIGAHAMGRADRLLTRDRGFYRTYFRGLRILDPTS